MSALGQQSASLLEPSELDQRFVGVEPSTRHVEPASAAAPLALTFLVHKCERVFPAPQGDCCTASRAERHLADVPGLDGLVLQWLTCQLFHFHAQELDLAQN